jgi:predicted Zn-dependent protease
MKTDTNICPACDMPSPRDVRLCTTCGTPLVLTSKGAVAVWRLGEVRPDVLEGVVRIIGKSLLLPVVVQPAFLDSRPSRRAEWRGASATAFLNQVDRRTDRGTVFSLGITEENIVPGAAWNFLFGYAYLGQPSCVITLHQMSSDSPKARDLVRRAAIIAIHEMGHNCGLDHHGYDEDIACVMTADTELDCLERLDEGTCRFCHACQLVVDRKLARHRPTGKETTLVSFLNSGLPALALHPGCG